MDQNITTRALFSFIWRYLSPQKWTFFAIFLTALAWSLDSTVWPYILRVVIDTLVEFDADRQAAWSSLQYPLLFGLFFWIFVEILFRLQGYLLARTIPKLEADIRLGMFNHIQHHSPSYFNEHFAGSLSNKITDMTTQVSLIVENILTLFIPALVSCLLGVAFLTELNPLFGMILGALIIIHFAICIGFSRYCDRAEHRHGLSRSELLGKIVDSFTNNFAVNLFYRFNFEKKYIGKYQAIEKQKNYEAKKLVELMRFCLGQATFWIGCVAINGFMFYLWGQGKLTSGEVAQIFNTTWNIIMTLWVAGTEIPQLFQSVGLAKQALTVMHHPQDLNNLPNAVPLVVSKGEIIFENVTFYYGNKKLFKNKNVIIKGGEKIGLVGYSGAGKSTFSNLILRLFPIDSGRIMIDGQDISKVTLESLRQNVALIPQDPILFHRSIGENIHYGNVDAPKEMVIKAAEAANCTAFINNRSAKYETTVGERGTKLSGGEKQRIAIARAVMSNARILILDEATSALDSVTENYIQESVDKLMEGKTTLVIAHRLSTLARMDRIIVFHQGEIVEEGTHEELLETGEHYKHLWQMQAGGFIPDDNESDDETDE